MGTPRNAALTITLGIIRGLYPAHTSKHLQRAWGLSRWQAARILKSGKVPSTIADTALDAMLNEAQRVRQNLAGIEDGLRQIRYARAVAKGQARGAEPVSTSASESDGVGARAGIPPVRAPK